MAVARCPVRTHLSLEVADSCKIRPLGGALQDDGLTMIAHLLPFDAEARFRVACHLLLFGVGAMCFLGLRSPTAFTVFTLVIMLAFALAPERTIKPLLREPLFWLALALFVAVFLRGWLDVSVAEAHGEPTRPDSIWDHARYGLLVPLLMGIGFALHWRYRYGLMLLIGLGFFVWVRHEWHAISARWPWPDGPEINYSFSEGGLIALTLFFLALAGVGAAFTERVRRQRVQFGVHLVVSVAVAISTLAVVVVSHSRSAYVTAAFTLLVVAIVAGCYSWLRGDRRERRIVGATLGAGAVLVLLTSLLAADFLLDKLDRYQGVVIDIVSGEVFRSGIPDDSGWVRAHLVLQGLLDTAERPWIGHGPSSVRYMVDDRFGVGAPAGDGDYHNTYINFAVAMGAPWALLWIAGHVWAIGRAMRHVLVVERDLVMALAIFGMAVAHFTNASFQLRIWSGYNSTAVYLFLMMIVCATVWRSVFSRQRV
ncbi:MAG: O-antigen ligase family protein [Spiribacter salinus]|uniref:O-antigen ligase family protein n=1 Tax=Spiribacter salinus TaxID=1335746 RepID=A0A540VNL0_9GAMM|nr:MAG: O-antigen ligase family protein [Spiribacter salinus]